jgi:hypothetical protein
MGDGTATRHVHLVIGGVLPTVDRTTVSATAEVPVSGLFHGKNPQAYRRTSVFNCVKFEGEKGVYFGAIANAVFGRRGHISRRIPADKS